jgi:hypothetical protein
MIDIVLALILMVLAGCFYAMAALPIPFSTGKKEKGEPICGHPFELTWGLNPKPDTWTCPKCFTLFEVRDGRWRMVK